MNNIKAQKQSSSLTAPLAYTLILRVFYSAMGAACTPYLKLNPVVVKSNDFTDNLMSRDAGWLYRLFGVWERFDTLWYVNIAEHGYDRAEAIVFYPLYPLLIRILSIPLRQPLAAALLISTVASFFMFWGFQKLLALDLPEEAVQRAMLLYAVWPASFTLFAGYPDSMMIALILWSIYAARHDRWWTAGILGFFAGLSKAAGNVVIIPLILIAWRERNWRAWPALISLVAPIAYMTFINLADFPPLSQIYPRYWRTEVAFPWNTLGTSLQQSWTGRGVSREGRILLIINLVIILLIFIPTVLKKLRFEYLIFSFATLALFFVKKTNPILQSTNRYVLAVFPAFAGWGFLLKNRLVFPLFLTLLLLINITLLMAFFEWELVI